MSYSIDKRHRITTNTWLEVLAVIFNLLYTYFYLNSNVWCYFFGIVGPICFVFLCIRKRLYAEPVLQLFYIGFAIYGWINWGGEWHTEHWPLIMHLPYLGVGLLVTALGGYYLKQNTNAAFPILDSFVTVFGIIGTWIMVNYVHENWLYFILINALSIYIYFQRQLFLGALMYVLYFFMAIDGYFQLGIFYS